MLKNNNLNHKHSNCFNILKLFGFFTLCLWIVVQTIVFFHPVYFDDVQYAVLNSRLGYDGWVSIGTSAVCRKNFILQVPTLLWPGGFFAWVAGYFDANFIVLRLRALAIVLLLMTGLHFLMRRFLFPEYPSLVIIGIIAAMIGFGGIPFLMLQGRPETGMVTAMVTLSIIPFMARHHNSVSVWCICVGSHFLISSWLFFIHPKMTLYAPFAFVVAALIPAPNRWLRAILPAIVIVMTIQSYGFWHIRYDCPESRHFNPFIATQAVSFNWLFSDPAYFLSRLCDNLLRFSGYIYSLYLWSHTSWYVTNSKWWPWMAGFNLLFTLMAFVLISVIVNGVFSQLYRAFSQRRFDAPTTYMAATLAIGVIAQTAIQLNKPFYNAGFIWVVICFAFVLVASQAAWIRNVTRTAVLAITAFMGLAIFSQVILIRSVPPVLWYELHHAEGDGVVRNDHTMISPIASDELERKVLTAAKQCNIPIDSSARYVVFDHSTYYPLKNSYRAVFYEWVFREYPDRKSLYSFLRKQRSSGIITSCRRLPSSIRQDAQDIEGVCCVGAEKFFPQPNTSNPVQMP